MSSKANLSESPRSLKPKFVTHLNQLSALAKQVIEYEKDAQKFGLFIEEKQDLEEKLNVATAKAEEKEEELKSLQTAMEQKLSAKNKDIVELQLSNNVLTKQFEARVRELTSEAGTKESIQLQLSRSQRKLADANASIESSKQILGEQAVALKNADAYREEIEDKLKQTTFALRSKEREMKGTESELEGYRLELEEANSLVGWGKFDEKYQRTQFQDLATDCYEIAKRFFLVKLPQGCKPDTVFLQLQRSGFYRDTLPYIPISDSLPSQHLRMAAAHKIIADQLFLKVFRSYYLPESLAACEVIDEIWAKLHSNDKRRAGVFHQNLLCAYQGADEEAYTRKLVGLVSQTILSKLMPLLPHPQSRESFKTEFEALLEKAVRVWRPVQRCSAPSRVTNEPDEDWEEYSSYDTVAELTSDQQVHSPVPSHPILPLFPRVTVGNSVISQGFALWSGQATVVAALLENSHYNSNERTNARESVSRDTGDRRLSLTSLSNGTAPAGVASKPPRKSFSSHVNSRSSTVQGSLSGSNKEE